MASIAALRTEMRSYGIRGLLLLFFLSAAAMIVLTASLQEVARGGLNNLLVGIVLGVVIAATTARHPVRFPATATSVSVSEPLIFLAVIMLGPAHAAILSVVESLVTGFRLNVRKVGVHAFNVSNFAISFFLSGIAYKKLSASIAAYPLASGIAQQLLAFALPLVALALTHYGLHVLMLWLMSAARGINRGRQVWDTLPWEPVTYMACATIA